MSFSVNLTLKGGLFAIKKKQLSVEQIVALLKEAEAGMSIAELIRRIGISEQTFYRWKKQYAGLDSDQARQLKQLREEKRGYTLALNVSSIFLWVDGARMRCLILSHWWATRMKVFVAEIAFFAFCMRLFWTGSTPVVTSWRAAFAATLASASPITG